MIIKLVVEECTLNVVSAYAPHVGLDEEVKRRFWEGLDEIVRQVPPTEKLFIGGDFNGHIRSTAGGYGEVHGGFDFGERKEERRKMSTRGSPRIRWRALTKDIAQELEGWLSVIGAWRSSGDVSTMWSAITDCIREVVREVLGVSTGISGRHKGDWWWNEVVQGQMEAKKVAYLKLVGSIDEEERRACMESYLTST
ncbi:uncharacterized protein LOC142180040 [Nicotiana tabacum]|uniref:Uncharacterized protein LOC142180040 n=1 Tax=Nicotiana tabacum TaxID=4097 RepID=A0AC58UC69_TOBAC